jgi:hypothetical protein
MAEGIQIYNAQGNLVVDSTKDWNYMEVIQTQSTGSEVGSVSYAPATELVWVKFPSEVNADPLVAYGWDRQTTTASFKIQANENPGTRGAALLELRRAQVTKNITSDSSSYGLQVLNTNGDVEFDSARLKNLGKMEVRRVYKAGTLAGTKQIGSTSFFANGTADHFLLENSVLRPASDNGAYFYFSVKGTSVFFNSYRRALGGDIAITNPCDVVVCRDEISQLNFIA